MENKYLEKVASWTQDELAEKYVDNNDELFHRYHNAGLSPFSDWSNKEEAKSLANSLGTKIRNPSKLEAAELMRDADKASTKRVLAGNITGAISTGILGGGLIGFRVGKATNPVLGTLAGIGAGALTSRGTFEGLNKLRNQKEVDAKEYEVNKQKLVERLKSLKA